MTALPQAKLTKKPAPTPKKNPADLKPAKPIEESAVDDKAIVSLHDRFRETIWRNLEGEEPLALSLCALILHTNPMIKTAEAIDALPIVNETLDLVDLTNAMANFERTVHRIEVPLADLDPRFGLCLFLLGNEQDTRKPQDPLVVTNIREVDGEKLFTVFSARQRKSYELHESDSLTQKLGTAVIFLPYDILKDPVSVEARRATKHSWFRALLTRFKATAVQLLLVSITLNTVALGTPLFIMLTYDRVIAPRTTDPLTLLIVGAVLAITMELALRMLRSQIVSWMTARLDFVIGTAIFARLLRLPPAMVERATVSAQIARIKTFESIRDFFCGPVFMSAVDLPTTFLAIAVIFVFGGALALVPIAAALAYFLVFWLLWRHVKVAIRQAATLTSISEQFAIETFEKMETIRSAGLQKVWADKYNDISGRNNHAQFHLYFLGTLGESLGQTISLAASLATLAVGVNLIWAGDISVGVLIAAMMLVWRVLAPFQSLCSLLPRFEQMRNGILQINQLMDVNAEDTTDANAARPPEFEGRLNFTSVSMRYEQGAGTVFMGLSFEAAPGDIVAITGPNGSGKSTVLKLIQGLYQPLTGAIRIDGFDIRQLMKRDLRRRIAYIPQTPQILPGTVADNLRFVRPLATEEELWAALRRVGAEEQVRDLPQGLDTPVSRMGQVNLPTEFAHRLAFARALLQKSAIILMDELPNALLRDTLGDVLRDIIKASRGKRTVVYVTHRADLMRLADKVVALRPGQTPVCGPVEKVLELAQ